MNALKSWVPENVMQFAVPLTEVYNDPNGKYNIHHYKGFDPSLPSLICDDILGGSEVILDEPVDIFLYLIDYPHEYQRLDRIGSNNGYTQVSGNYYSIVIFRKLFWPKVLVHELLHVLWFLNKLPIAREFPRWDEAIIEAHAVRISIMKGYINESEYKYYLNRSKSEIINCVGGDINQLKKKQKTHLYEYLFLSSQIRELIGNE